MQRSMGDEVLIAIIALAVIAFATVFGLILSLVAVDDEIILTPTATLPVTLATRQPTATINFTPFATFTIQASPTVSPTITPTASNTFTASPTPTRTLTRPASVTPSLTATSTSTHTVTSTPTANLTPSLTSTATASLTSTRIPPTATVTVIPSETPTSTASATLTSTVTLTMIPTDTPSQTASATATVTRTATPRPTQTATRTSSPTPSRTPTVTATATNTPTQTVTPTATTFVDGGDCDFPPRWTRHIVMMGETLSTLAAVADVPVERILRRNCLPDDYQAITGDAILLPTEGEFGRVIAPDAPLDCSAPEVASFTTIQAGQTLSGQVEIRGVAGGADFRRYHLDIRPDGYLRPIAILSGNTPVNGRVLGLLETDDLPLGLAWLRLTIITGAGTMTDGQVCVIPVIIAR